jgi:SpoVK/Ycf46/Vps4 family AAA+-type ATPase
LVEPYKSSLEHILDELTVLDLLLGYAISKLKKNNENRNWNEFSGLYISDEEAYSEFTREIKDGKFGKIEDTDGISEKIRDIRSAIDQRVDETRKLGIPLHLDYLQHRFSLCPFEISVILLCLAPELDSKYERLYAYIQNNIMKKRPSIGFALDLLCHDIEQRIERRKYFSKSSPLFDLKVLEMTDPQDNEPYLLSKQLKINALIVDFLLGQGYPINKNGEGFSIFVPQENNDGYFDLYYDLKEIIMSHIKDNLKEGTYDHLAFYLQGPHGIGKKTIAQSVCFEVKVPMVIVDLEDVLLSTQMVTHEEVVGQAFLQALLVGGALYLDNFDSLNGIDDAKIKSFKNSVLKKVSVYYGLIFVAGEKPWDYGKKSQNLIPNVIEIPQLSYSMRKTMWEACLKNYSIEDQDLVASLSNDFVFTPKQIIDSVRTVRNFVSVQQGKSLSLSRNDLYRSCRLQSNQILSNFSHKIIPRYALKDIVLPHGRKVQLEEILNYVKYRHLVLSEWGFEQNLSLGKGLNILFEGESGTGKTMAAEIIAHELKLDLYKIDLSSIVSKYIGETEKNLSSVFKEAETSNAIIFFDEADAIFGKRSEIKDAHDRYANIEINYLLQKLEEHTGITILATNLAQNIDDAFTRRIHFSIEFPFPNEDQRMKIWEMAFPANAPLHKEVDINLLSRQFSVTGGAIKNVALKAAFRAAKESSDISMTHIILALKEEYEKLGKPCLKSDFGKYSTLLESVY